MLSHRLYPPQVAHLRTTVPRDRSTLMHCERRNSCFCTRGFASVSDVVPQPHAPCRSPRSSAILSHGDPGMTQPPQPVLASTAGTVRLGDLTVNRMGYGAMRITG